MTLELGSRSLLKIWRVYAPQLPPGSRRLGILESADAFLIDDLAILRVPYWRFDDLRPPTGGVTPNLPENAVHPTPPSPAGFGGWNRQISKKERVTYSNLR